MVKRLQQLQYLFTHGRFTFPIVSLLSVLLWCLNLSWWTNLISLSACILTVYCLIELNTTFTLMHTRTNLHALIYAFLLSASFFLHPYTHTVWIPLLYVLSVYQLFYCFEQKEATYRVFKTFLSISIGSVIQIMYLWLVPVFWIGMLTFRCFSWKTFFASLIALLSPYWFVGAYALYKGDPTLLTAHFDPLFSIPIPDYSGLSIQTASLSIMVFVLFLVSTGYYFLMNYRDKMRARFYLSFLILTAFVLWAVMLCIPEHFEFFLRIQLLVCAICYAHLLSLIHNRFTSILFFITFVGLLSYAMLNVWTLSYNF